MGTPLRFEARPSQPSLPPDRCSLSAYGSDPLLCRWKAARSRGLSSVDLEMNPMAGELSSPVSTGRIAEEEGADAAE